MQRVFKEKSLIWCGCGKSLMCHHQTLVSSVTGCVFLFKRNNTLDIILHRCVMKSSQASLGSKTNFRNGEIRPWRWARSKLWVLSWFNFMLLESNQRPALFSRSANLFQLKQMNLPPSSRVLSLKKTVCLCSKSHQCSLINFYEEKNWAQTWLMRHPMRNEPSGRACASYRDYLSFVT